MANTLDVYESLKQTEKEPEPKGSLAVYESLVSEDPEKTQARLNLNLAAESNPDTEAQVLDLAEQTGRPAPLVRETLEDSKRVANEIASEKFLDPGVVQYLAEEAHAKVSHDDTEGLSMIERTVKYWRDFGKDITQAWKSGNQTVELGKLGYRRYIQMDGSVADRLKDLEAEQISLPESQDWLGIGVTATTQMLPYMLAATEKGAKRGMQGAIIGGVGATVVGLPIGAPAAAAIMAAPSFVVGLGESVFVVESGSAAIEYSNMRDAEGNRLNPELVRVMSLAVGALTTSVELLSDYTAGKLVLGTSALRRVFVRKAVAKAVTNPTVMQALMSLAQRSAGAIGVQSMEEMVQEATAIIGGEILKSVANSGGAEFEGISAKDALTRVGTAGKMAALAVPGLILPGALIRARISVRDVQAASEYKDAQLQINEKVNASKTKERSPELMEKFLESAGLGDDVFIKGDLAEEFYQQNPDIAGKIDLDEETASQASAEGQDVKLKLSTLHSKLEADEFAKIAEIIKPGPAALSEREAALVDTEAELDQLVELFQAQQEDETVFQSDLQRLRSEALTAGRSEEEVDSWLEIVEDFSRRHAEEGGDLTSLAQRLTGELKGEPGVVAQNFADAEREAIANFFGQEAVVDEDGVVYDQAGQLITESEPFQRWFGESQVVDEAGQPLVVYHGTNVATVFESFFPWSHFGTIGQAEHRIKAIAFAEDKSASPRTFPAYLNIKRPLSMDDIGDWDSAGEVLTELARVMQVPEKIKQAVINEIEYEGPFDVKAEAKGLTIISDFLMSEGYDGIVYENLEEGAGPSYIAFNPNQIKSVFNQGTFDATSAKILEQRPTQSNVIYAADRFKTPKKRYEMSFDEYFGLLNAEDPDFEWDRTTAEDIFVESIQHDIAYGDVSLAEVAERYADFPPVMDMIATMKDLDTAGMQTAFNASGESAASLEALSVEASRKAGGTKLVIIDTRSGKTRPTIGPRPEDNALNPHDILVQVDGDKAQVINVGSNVLKTEKKIDWISKFRTQLMTEEFFQQDKPTVPLPGELEQLTLIHGHVEEAFQKVVDSVEGDLTQLTSERLAEVPGAPKARAGKEVLDRNVKPRSFEDLRTILKKAMELSPDRRWYSEFGRVFQNLVGEANMQESSIIFGITSAQNQVRTNFADTLHIMAMAREADPLTEETAFRNFVKEVPRADGKSLFISPKQLDSLVDVYQTGMYTGGPKITSYMRGVKSGASNIFAPFTVQDVHMSRVFGYGFRRISAATGRELDAAEFPSNNAVRYGQFMTALLAREFGLRPSAVQEYLWFYAKHFLSSKQEGQVEQLAFTEPTFDESRLLEGTAKEAFSYAKGEIQAISEMIAAKQFDTENPISQVFADAPLPNFDAETITTPYNTADFAEELLAHAESVAPQVLISAIPGHGKGYGLEMSLSAQIDFNQDVLKAISNTNGQILILNRMGIPHTVGLTMGSFGALEPSIVITLPGEGLATAHIVAKLLGHALLQDGAIAGQPRVKGTQKGIRAVSKSGSIADLGAILEKVNPTGDTNGINFTMEADGKALRFLNLSGDFDAFAKELEILSDEFNFEIFTQESEYHELDKKTGTEIWDETGLTTRPDIQRAAVHTLYKPAWGVYREKVGAFGLEKSGKPSPIEEVRGYLERDREWDASWNVNNAKLPVNADGLVPLTHFGTTGGLETLDPSKHGTGAAGEENVRKGHPGWLDRTYYGLPGYVKETMVPDAARYFSFVQPQDIYDLKGDPLGISHHAVETNRDVLGPGIINLVETAIAQRGYKGYWGGKAVALFEKQHVQDVTNIEEVKKGVAGFDPEGVQDAPQKKFFQRPIEPRGSLVVENNRYLIKLFETANKSTLIHETSHIFLEEIKSLISSGNASQKLVNDWGSIQRWLGVTLEEGITKDQHETFARSFEAYLMEGKAPSKELETAFQRFRTWLTEIYKSVKNKELTVASDEIKGVFDRLLATEQEIDLYSDEIGLTVRTPSEMDALGLKDADRAFLNRLVQGAKDKAKIQYQKAKDRNRLKLVKQWTDEAREIVAGIQVYRLREDLAQKGRGLDLATIREEYGSDVVKRINAKRLGLVQEEGRNPAQVAADYEYQDVRTMIDELLNSRTKTEEVADIVATKQQGHDRQFDAEGPVIENDDLEGYMDAMGRYIGKALGREERISSQSIQRFAERNLANMPLRKALRIDRFLSAMQRSMKQEREAISKGDFETALQANHQARLNYHYARQVKKLQRKVDSFERRSKRIAKNKGGISINYLENLKEVLRRYSIVKTAPVDPAKMVDLSKLLGSDEFFADAPEFSDWLFARQDEVSYKDLAVDDFFELSNFVKHLETKGRAEAKGLKLLLTSLDMPLDEALQQVIEPLKELKGKKKIRERDRLKKIKFKAREYAAANKMFLFIMRVADGFVNTGKKGVAGANETLIYDNLVAAGNRETLLRNEYTEALTTILQHFKDKLGNREFPKNLDLGVPVPDIMAAEGLEWTYERVMAVAFNMGTEYNKSTFMEGFNIDEAQLQKILSVLDDSDWDQIQSMWDVVNSFWGRLSEVYETRHGIRPTKVKATPFTTSTGKQMKGGYYPIRFDSSLDAKTQEREEINVLEHSANAAFAPAPASGMLKKRRGSGGKPIYLSLGVLTQHLDYVAKYIAYAETIRDVNRLTSNPEYRGEIKRVMGKDFVEGETSIRRLLKDIVGAERERLNAFDKVANLARTAATRYMLGVNPSVALKQAYSLPGFVMDVGMDIYRKGLLHTLTNPKQAYETMIELSPAMKERVRRVDRDTMIALGPDTKRATYTRDVINFFLIHLVDGLTVTPAWHGAYIQGMDMFAGDRGQAVAYADKTIAASQPFNRIIDMAQHQRSKKGVHVLFNMFSSFTMKFGNRAWYYTQGFKQGKIDWPTYLKHIAIERILPPMLMSLMYSTLWGDEPDWEDVGFDVLLYQVIGLPFFRDLSVFAASAYRQAKGKGYKRGVNSPAFTVVELTQRALASAFQWSLDLEDPDKAERAQWALFELMSFTVGVPASKVASKVKRGMEQIADGEGGLGARIGIPEPKRRN